MKIAHKRLKKCPECGSEQFFLDKSRGEVICAKCGLVLEEEVIDLSKERRSFDLEQAKKRARTGPPVTVTRHDKGMRTTVGRGFYDLSKVPASKRAQYYRLMKKQVRVKSSKKRTLRFGLSEIKRAISFLNLPRKVHERVAVYYKRVVDKGLIRGRNIESIVAALIYAVAKELETPRTLEEVSEFFGFEREKIGKVYRYVARKLGLRILPSDPKNYIPRFGSMLGLSDKTKAKALRILKKVKKTSVASGKEPTGVAAAVLYIAAALEDEKRSQREIADTVGVTEVTIRNRQKEITKKLKIDLER